MYYKPHERAKSIEGQFLSAAGTLTAWLLNIETKLEEIKEKLEELEERINDLELYREEKDKE